MSDLRMPLPDDVHHRLRVVATMRKTTIKAVVLKAVLELLKKEEKEAK